MSQVIINSADAKKLRKLASFEKMLTDEYLTDKKHLQTAFIYEQFFATDDKLRDSRLALLNISYSIPSLVCEVLSNYVGQPNTPFEFDQSPFTCAYSWGGKAIFKSRLVDGEFVIEFASPDGYLEDSDGRERLLTWIKQQDDSTGIITQYIFEQVYTDGLIENNLYKVVTRVQASDGRIFGTKVPLNTLEATAGILDTEETGLDRSPLVVVKNSFDGQSDIAKVRSLISSIEIQVVNMQDQFLKHLQAKLAIPASGMPIDEETGLVDLSKLQVIAMEAGDTPPMYILNTNPLIDKSFVLVENFIRQIAAILSIPVEFFGLKDAGGAESADAKRIRISSFIKRVEVIRTKFETGYFELNDVAKQWGAGETEDFETIWGSIFPVNKKEQVDELSTARESGLISQKRAIKEYLDVSEEDAEAEIEEIKKEEAVIDAADLGV